MKINYETTPQSSKVYQQLVLAITRKHEKPIKNFELTISELNEVKEVEENPNVSSNFLAYKPFVETKDDGRNGLYNQVKYHYFFDNVPIVIVDEFVRND